ncbi:hypothetical protein D3C71_1204650 [compost metagenome]
MAVLQIAGVLALGNADALVFDSTEHCTQPATQAAAPDLDLDRALPAAPAGLHNDDRGCVVMAKQADPRRLLRQIALAQDRQIGLDAARDHAGP